MNLPIAIKVHQLSKVYRLYESPISRLVEALHPLKRKYSKEFSALTDLNMEIYKGETVGIVGRNGSGKSTLLKIITGVLKPSAGHVAINGKVSAILELGAGFNPELTGLENIYLNNSLNGLGKLETDKRITDIVDFADLGEFIQQPVKTYSSGMKARLAFAVSISVQPDILIVDEALSVGDAAFARKCFAKMEEIRSKGATILFVSHSEGSIVNLCSRAIWVNAGQKVLDGPPKLVVGLYMKHVSAKKLDPAAVQREFTQLINSSVVNANEPIELEGAKQSYLNVKPSAHTTSIEEFFDNNLVSKSLIEYPQRGARIYAAQLSTLDGRKVNVLKQGQRYAYTYQVEFTTALQNVQFGFLIKQQDGTALGGGALPGRSEYIASLSGVRQVRIVFRCDLTAGVYFLNCGVLADIAGKSDYAHRILDAYMFKVVECNAQATSSVNFIDKFSIEVIK